MTEIEFTFTIGGYRTFCDVFWPKRPLTDEERRGLVLLARHRRRRHQ